MLKFFESILNLIKTIIGFVISTIQHLLTFLTMIPAFATKILEFIGYMPSWLTAFLIAGVSIIILKAVLGRE